jgi:predicted transcriptional regulator
MVLKIPHYRSILLLGDTAMRKQFVLDKRTNKLLEELASYNGGNRSLIVRQAIQVYSDMEDRLDKIEADPAFQDMMEESDRAIREGRVTPHEEVVRMSRGISKRKTKKRR